jgi:hypothetical protein
VCGVGAEGHGRVHCGALAAPHRAVLRRASPCASRMRQAMLLKPHIGASGLPCGAGRCVGAAGLPPHDLWLGP